MFLFMLQLVWLTGLIMNKTNRESLLTLKIKMKNKLLSFIAIALIFTQCAPVYVPTTRNIPDIEKKGEAKLSAIFSSSGYELNTNYMVVENLGLMANFSFANEKFEEGNKSHKHNFGELGIGYHFLFGKANAAIYAGHGFGSASAEDLNLVSDPIFAEGDFQRTFIQPSVAFNLGFFIPSVALRFTRVSFHNFIDDISIEPSSETGYFFEPALQFGFRFDPFEADLQVGILTPLTDQASFAFEYRVFNVAVGLGYRINYSK